MLLELHVKNLALIEQADVEFGDGLNILTGETGAGKSIIIGSVNLALGQKAPKEMIRSGSDYAYVELIFSVEEEKRELLERMDVYPDDDGTLIITRKIMPTRSVSKINDETVTVTKLKEVTGLLIDIHGQHEHQSLLHASKHLEILDTYAKSQIGPIKEKTASLYKEYGMWKVRLEELSGDEESRRREYDFLRFEVDEIEQVGLKDGEEEELTERYRFYSNSRKIAESLSVAYEAVNSEMVGRAIHEVGDVVDYDQTLKPIQDQLYDAESLLDDVHHAIGSYLEDISFNEEEMRQTEERLDLIHNLQAKYGSTAAEISRTLEEKQKRLEELEHFDDYRREAETGLKKAEKQLETACEKLSEARKKASVILTEKIRERLLDLNFLDVKFSMSFSRLSHYTANGFDEAEFVISTNPGEPERSLGLVASGGELSRIMLAIKTVLADTDEIPTLIFDEIDTGISGRTAQKVSEQLAIISKNHQVICITHLPQIASMADEHFEIAKSAKDGKTRTVIHELDETQMIAELARLLGGVEITGAVLENAKEMKRLAQKTREEKRRTF